ncbi:MAG: hypothetical protein IKC87_04525 [Clostridia bacterium]|nr:hypothetical protein [Clostridia bacterium]
MTLDLLELLTGKVSISELGERLSLFFTWFGESSAVKPVIGMLDPKVLGTLLIIFFLMLTFFGQRMIGFFNFVLFFVLGYITGAAWILSLSEPILISPIIAGISFGIVSALISKLLYYAFLIPVFGFLVYLPLITGSVIPDTAGDYLLGISLGAAFVILLFIFREWAERPVTAVIGAYGVAESVKILWDYTSLEVFSLAKWLPVVSFTLVLGIIGFVLQVKTRKLNNEKH